MTRNYRISVTSLSSAENKPLPLMTLMGLMNTDQNPVKQGPTVRLRDTEASKTKLTARDWYKGKPKNFCL
jgi:hypothetical protein